MLTETQSTMESTPPCAVATITELEENKQTREKLLDNARAEADALKASMAEAQEELDAVQKERLELLSLTRAEIEGFKDAFESVRGPYRHAQRAARRGR